MSFTIAFTLFRSQTKEFSSENLLFWQEVRQWRSSALAVVSGGGAAREQTSTVLATLFAIHRKYILRGAPYEVNLPHDLRELASAPVSALETLAADAGASQLDVEAVNMQVKDFPSVLDAAAAEVLALMEKDSFRRYKKQLA